MENFKIGQRIKETRLELGLSLDEVANKVGVAKSTIQRYESGAIGKIKLPIVESIAKELKVNPAWLLCKSNDKDIPNIENEISEYVRVFENREDLRELFNIAVNSPPSMVKKIIDIFKIIND